jgi:hypothetical protein
MRSCKNQSSDENTYSRKVLFHVFGLEVFWGIWRGHVRWVHLINWRHLQASMDLISISFPGIQALSLS